MSTIDRRTGRGGKVKYRARVRLRGSPPLLATFDRLVEARDWARDTEHAIRAGRHAGTEVRRRSEADLVDRYIGEVVPTLRGRERPWERAITDAGIEPFDTMISVTQRRATWQ